MSKNKIISIILGLLTVLYFILKYSVSIGVCSYSDYKCITNTDKAEYILFVVPLSLFLSLISLFTKETVFDAWWKFAQWGIPLVLVVSFIISLELHHTPGGWFNLDKEVDLAMTTVLYLLFILGSAWQMYRGFRAKA